MANKCGGLSGGGIKMFTDRELLWNFEHAVGLKVFNHYEDNPFLQSGINIIWDETKNHITGIAFNRIDIQNNTSILAEAKNLMISLLYLKKLIIYYCSITNIPDWIMELKTLNSLGIAGNFLTILPEEIKNLKTLSSLFIA
jgi:Leucine-rich repeat (LRR) protein